MTFDQILVFHKIVELGSFKSAAAELNKTQPAISFSIKKLEEEMGVELFDRSLYRPTMTSHGRAFYERSSAIILSMKDLENLSKSFLQKEEPEIAFSLDGICLNPKLLKFVKSFSDRHPFTKLNLCIDTLSETERRVFSKECEIGMTHFIKEPQFLDVIPVDKVTMVPVMNKDLFKEKKVKDQSDLLLIDQIVIGDKNPQGASFGLLEGGKRWRLLDNNFKREIIFAGLGWGHLPLHNIEKELKEKKLVILEFEDIHPRDLQVNLIRHKKQQLGPIAKTLWDELIAFHQ